MNRNAEITHAFTRWLERYTPPASIRDNARAMQDEADTLLRSLIRSAPNENSRQWVERVLERVSENLKTRAWPTAHEITEAAKSFGAGQGSGDIEKMTRDERFILEDKVIPTAERWMNIPGLREHAEKTLAHWGRK